ncbi:hypothetical protein AB6802_02975 [Mesorhizobium sp. RCC_202]|uniref:hypothetical protein n=1 Tax=Mesorhizobium sp. RCC_202 TaxID=3239222 RepID=UPI003525FCBC
MAWKNTVDIIVRAGRALAATQVALDQSTGESGLIREVAWSMKAYRVEEMENDTVRATHVIRAFTAFQAAALAVNREVTLRKDEPNWIRVTETSSVGRQLRDGQVFAFRIGGYPPHG